MVFIFPPILQKKFEPYEKFMQNENKYCQYFKENIFITKNIMWLPRFKHWCCRFQNGSYCTNIYL